jgi:hypothetical protein
VHEEREPPGHGGTPRRTNHTVHALRALSVWETLPADLWLFNVCVTPCRDKLQTEQAETRAGRPEAEPEPAPNPVATRFSFSNDTVFHLINPLLQSDLDTRYRLEAL